MTNNFLTRGALIAFRWVFANAPPPEPTSRAAPLRATTTEPAITSYVIDAEVVGRYPGYASQRLFRFDHAAASALEGALPPPRLSAKRSHRDRLETAVKSRRLA
jgi:hypothetical protein